MDNHERIRRESAQRILQVIREYLNQGKNPTWLDIQFGAGVAPSSIAIALKHLEESGAVRIERRIGIGNRYSLPERGRANVL